MNTTGRLLLGLVEIEGNRLLLANLEGMNDDYAVRHTQELEHSPPTNALRHLNLRPRESRQTIRSNGLLPYLDKCCISPAKQGFAQLWMSLLDAHRVRLSSIS